MLYDSMAVRSGRNALIIQEVCGCTKEDFINHNGSTWVAPWELYSGRSDRKELVSNFVFLSARNEHLVFLARRVTVKSYKCEVCASLAQPFSASTCLWDPFFSSFRTACWTCLPNRVLHSQFKVHAFVPQSLGLCTGLGL